MEVLFALLSEMVCLGFFSEGVDEEPSFSLSASRSISIQPIDGG